jgi:hypothetical protein
MPAATERTWPTQRIPGGLCAAFETNLADGLEPVVPNEASLLCKVEENAMRIFIKCNSLAIDSNFNDAPVSAAHVRVQRARHGYRDAKVCPASECAHFGGKTNFTMPGKTPAVFADGRSRAVRDPHALAFA